MSNPKYRPFKPPRPSGSAGQAASNPRQSTAPAAKPSSPLSSDGFESLPPATNKTVGDISSDSDVPMHDQPRRNPAKKPVELTIPRPLLARVLHDSFAHADTRVTSEAMDLLGKYIDVFTLEALGRANQEREEAVKKGKEEGREVDGGFLEVEDLERLAPQLLLDL